MRQKLIKPPVRYAFSESDKVAIEQQGYKAVAKLKIESEGIEGWIMKLKKENHGNLQKING